MSPELTIIMPVLNDQEELTKTLVSLISTAGDPGRYEVIVVDDCSMPPMKVYGDPFTNVKLIRNPQRLGVGPSRHLGAQEAKGEYLFLVDAHSRFTPGWVDLALERIVGRPTTMHCGVCLGLGYGAKELPEAKGRYTGATLCLWNPETKEIFEGKWLPEPPKDDEEIPCVMGACYFIPRKWFLALGGLKMLRMWGSDEPYLSLKCWLAGGDIRFLETVEIGHMFRDNAPYVTEVWNLLYNKVRAIQELMDQPTAAFLLKQLSHDQLKFVQRQMDQDGTDVLIWRQYYKKLFLRDLRWYCDRFQIRHPLQVDPVKVVA